MTSHQQPRKQSTTGGQGQEEGGRRGARGQQGQEAMNLEEIGKYRAEAQQHSVDVIRAAEERFNRANQQQKESHGCGGGHEVAGHAGTEAKQWLADAASDARERCNRAMGMSPAASHGATAKGPAAQSYAGATAASRAKETKKASSTEAEQEGRGNVLTRQGEMGHGRQADKVSEAEAVEKHDKGKKAGGQQQSAKDTASHAVGAEAKDAGARGAAEKTEQATQQAAAKARDETVATGAQVAQKAKEVTAGAEHRVAEYSKEKADQGKEESGSVKTTKDSAAEKIRDGMTGRRHEHGEARRAEGAAGATGSVAQKASDTAWRARDKAGEAKHRASSETGITDSGGTGRDKEEEESTTIVGDVLEAVGATVVGLAQHAKGIVAGEEELVPGDVVEAREAKVAGAKKEEKGKTA